MSSRSYVLDRLRVALDAASVGESQQARQLRCAVERAELQRTYRRTGSLSPSELVAMFEDRVGHYNGSVYRVEGSTSNDIAHSVSSILASRGKRILITPPAFPKEWLPAGYFFIPDENLSNDQLNSNDGVITLCSLGIASTGTVILESSREQGRRAATLLPDYHLCLLRADRIVELVPEAFSALEGWSGRPLTFVSGPSATVDIEMTRVQGVHGPRTLDILLI